MSQLKLYNTLSRSKEDFIPSDEKRVTMYVCGPTVYSYAHIGNARSAVAFDLLFRVLRHVYGEDHVVYARNITDVDDKINKAAYEQGVDISVITKKFAKIYQDDLAALGNLSPTIQPWATETMDEIIEMIQALVDKGHAYEAEGHVLFDVSSYADYGHLSKRSQDEMIAGARVEVAPYKKNPSDFVLWKPSDETTPGWESPWGEGRPGWHIECSSMIAKHLGRTIDIHCGGIDLTFPHHENEVAQSTCAHDGETFVRYWLHNGFLNMGDEKMSKSLGNVTLIRDLNETYPPEAIRMALLSAQYRQPLTWTDSLIDQAITNLDKFYKKLEELSAIEIETPRVDDHVLEALLDDLNTPKAYAALFALLKDKTLDDKDLKAKLLGSAHLLGFLQDSPQAWQDSKKQRQKPQEGGLSDDEINALIQERLEAKKAKDFAKADQIRDDLISKNVMIKDTPNGTDWERQ